MVLALTACSGGNAPAASPVASAPASEPVATPSPQAEQTPEVKEPAPSDDNEQVSETARPQTETFDLMAGDADQPLTATLHQGEGFSLYVFEKFFFDAATGRLSLSSNPDYYVDIEPLPADYDPAELETAGREELGKINTVSEFSGELVEHPLGFVEIYLQTSGGNGVSDYIVWKSEEGDAYLFRLHNPKGEEASDFATPVLASLSTVQGDS
ncbi:hypothetical protein B9T62_12725 [Paenibacillus donghaensis]|uniref:Uncharacterized protein n=2 Tax=Paenibacillus donghaensis TaxID=414771 RepID=A0A2Z2KR11_9BACL|nr:hypothetical protein B9T62_12725 [Paenibacillus donghaensis]